MAQTATITFGILYTPPSAAANSGNASFSTQASYNAQNVGQLDVQTSDAPATTFAIPFGSVSAGKIVMVRNMMSTEIGIRLNAAGSDNMKLPAGGEFVYAASVAPNATPLTAVTIVTTASPAQIENVMYWVFGD